MRIPIALMVPALAGCGDEPEVKLTNATPDQVVAEVKESGLIAEARFQPGRWRVDTQVQDVVIGGVPPQVVAQMKAQLSVRAADVQCLTPEQAERPNAGVFAGKQNGSCKYDSFQMSGGALKATMSCPGATGARMAMTMDGRYSPTSFEVDAEMRMDSFAPEQSMTVKVRSTGTRIGECSAGG